MFAGHGSRLWSARNNLNWASFSCAIIGLIGSVLQSIATGLSFHHMPPYEVYFLYYNIILDWDVWSIYLFFYANADSFQK
jgi:hypothetical protein